MNKYTRHFVDEISAIYPRLAQTHRETIKYWSPEDPPVTIVFGEIGDRIVEDFDAIEPGTKRTLFRRIEEGMASEDEELGTAVATGLIEAMIGKASHLGKNWEMFRPHLGPLTRSHADAWLSF